MILLQVGTGQQPKTVRMMQSVTISVAASHGSIAKTLIDSMLEQLDQLWISN